MPDEFANEAIDVPPGNLSLNLAAQAVDALRQLDGHTETLAQSQDGLRFL
jgi:hypothetical protein